MPPRPARSATRNVSYKIEGDTEEGTRRGCRVAKVEGHNSDEEPEGLEDDDDSDEYVEPEKSQGDDDDDEDDQVDMDVPEDDDEILRSNGEVGKDEQVRKGGSSKEQPPKVMRRRKGMQSFTVSTDQMSDLLDTRHDAGAVASSKTTSTLKFTRATLPTKLAPVTTTLRGPRPAKYIQQSRLHKRGELHSSDLIPPNWKLSYQAPTSEDVSHASMQEETLRVTVYPGMRSNVKDFRVLSESSDLDEYLPILATTKVYAREAEIDLHSMTAQYIENTAKTGLNDYYLLNTGFSVWAMDWCPLPSYDADEVEQNRNFVAVGGFPDTAENCIARDQLYPLGKQDAHPNMIQLWSMNCNTNNDGELQGDPSVYLAMCILHPYGAVFDLKWCPTGGLMDAGAEPGDLARLGILAAAFSDGTIRIFSIPQPDKLREHLRMNSGESTPETMYIEYPEPYATIRLGDVNFMSINWGTSQRLAAGVTNGTVAVWDTHAMLSQSKETLAEKDSEFLDPIYLPQVHDVCVRCVDWLRSEDAKVVPWVIATSGYDGHVRYTDLRDPFAQIGIKTILGAPMASMCVPWAEGTVYVDIDFGAKLDQLYLESRGFRLFNAKGTIWDFSYSDYQPYLAAAISDGRVKISNPAYKARRGYGMIQNCIYQIQQVKDEDDLTATSGGEESVIEGDSGLVSEERSMEKQQIFSYKDGEEKEYSSKSDGFLDFYGANVAIQAVQWSRCFHSAAWLASGSAGGLVRIDNTMLRSEEGGSGNKIIYALEPYVLKKRLAAGQKYDEEGRRVGPDGQPVKIGRPRKAEADTKRGKKKLAALERQAKAAALAAEKAANKGPRGRPKRKTVDSQGDPTELSDAADEDWAAGSGRSSRARASDQSHTVDVPAEKRPTRQSSRLAPIFTRTASSNPAVSTSAAVEGEVGLEESMDEQEEGRDEEEEEREEEASSKRGRTSRKPAKAPTTATDKEVPNPKRGRSKKNAGAIEPSKVSSQTILSMIKGPARSTQGSEGDVEMAEASGTDEDQVMEEIVSASAPKTNDKGKAKAVTVAAACGMKPTEKAGARRGRQTTLSKSKQAHAASAEGAEEAAVTEALEMETLSLTTTAAELVQAEERPNAPSSPRKKRGTNTSKKRGQDVKRQNHSLMDLWGAAAANKAAKSDDRPNE